MIRVASVRQTKSAVRLIPAMLNPPAVACRPPELSPPCTAPHRKPRQPCVATSAHSRAEQTREHSASTIPGGIARGDDNVGADKLSGHEPFGPAGPTDSCYDETLASLRCACPPRCSPWAGRAALVHSATQSASGATVVLVCTVLTLRQRVPGGIGAFPEQMWQESLGPDWPQCVRRAHKGQPSGEDEPHARCTTCSTLGY